MALTFRSVLVVPADAPKEDRPKQAFHSTEGSAVSWAKATLTVEPKGSVVRIYQTEEKLVKTVT